MLKLDCNAFADSFFKQSGYHADANETAIFGRQLEDVIAGSFDVMRVANKARQIMPFNTSVGNGAQAVSYKQYDFAADAAWTDDYATDIPRVEITGAEFWTSFHSFMNSYGYSIQDWRSAKMAGLPLDAKLASAAREGCERFLERVAAFGDSAKGVTGFANAPNVPILGLSDLSNTVWLPGGGGTTSTPLQIFSDMATIFQSIWNTTLTTIEADTVVFPTRIFGYLRSTLFQPTYNTKTVLQALLEANPWIKNVDVWIRLNAAGADGKGRVVVFKRDPRVLEFMLSQDFESFPPQVQGASFTITNHMRVGGVQVRYPKAMAYVDGLGGTLS